MVKDPCAYCGGTGAIRCNHCGGTGINENSILLHDHMSWMQRDGQGKLSELPGNRRVAACWHRSKPRATNTSRVEEHSESRVAVMNEYIGAMSTMRLSTL